MAIIATCNSCGKQYNAPDSMAGKSVKCKQCGQIFQIPTQGGEPASEDELSALAALERSFQGQPGQTSPHVDTMQHPSPGHLPSGDDDDDMPFAPRPGGGRANVRFKFPFAHEIDQYLPPVLVIGGLAGLAAAVFKLDDMQIGWLSTIRLLVLVLCYVALIFPLSSYGVRMAGQRVGFQLPRTSRWRAFATFMPALAIGVLIWLAGGGSLGSLILGAAAGLFVSLAVMMLLFRLWPEEIGMASVYTAVMFSISIALCAGVLLGLNLLLSTVLVATKKISSVPASPFGVAFSWPPPEKPQLAMQTPPIKPKPKPGPEATNIEPAHTNDTSSMPPKPPEIVPGNPVTQGTQKPPMFDVGDQKSTGESPLANATPVRTGENTAPSNPVESSTAELPTTRPSPLVQSIEVAAITPGYDTLIEPLTPSAWLAVARGSADQRGQIERWSMQPGHPSMLSGSVPRTHDSIASDAYVLAPTGDLLARVSSWPSPSVLIYLYPNGALLQTLPIQQDSDPTARITSQVFGFLPTFDQKNPDRLLVHRRNEKTGTDSFEVWDPRANRRIKLIPVAPFERCVGTTAVSSDGLTLAVAARGDNALTAASQPPTLYLYDVSGGAGSQVKSKLPIAPLKTPGAVRPTGMAFSPDNSRLAMLFEENGTGLLVIYSISNRGLSQQSSRVFPPMPVSAPMSWDGSSITWVGKNALLLYGQLIIDATTGESAGNTGISAITSQRFTPPDMLQLTFRDSSGQQRIALLKLDIKQIDELTKVKK